jgi:chemotaxis protein histidine kinase CheA
MATQPIASVILLEQSLPERFIAAVRIAVRKIRALAVLALGLALVPLPTQAAFGQINSQQEQQQRDQQQREEQQREQQQRDQQQRDQQQREQQQREEQQRQQEQRDQQQREQEQQRQQQQREQEQQREQQQREQQEREQQQREQQAREQQQREQQQREQRAREQQQREEQQREQQQREAQERQQQQRDQEVKAQQQREQQAREQQQRSSEFPVPSSKSGSEVSHATAKTPAGDLKRAPSDIQSAGTERKPEASLPIKPAPRPIEPKPVPELAKKTCKDGPCQPCSSTQSKGKKDGPCDAAAAAKAGAPATPGTGPESCAAGQVWNGTQCLPVGAQSCLPGQSGLDGSCHVDCTSAIGGAQNWIMELRSARQNKDQACMKDPTSRECSQAESDYDMSLTEYQSYLAGVPIRCQSMLPSPIAI